MISHITHEHLFFSEGHKDVTWVLVTKVFLQGSKLKQDPDTAPQSDCEVEAQIIAEKMMFSVL